MENLTKVGLKKSSIEYQIFIFYPFYYVLKTMKFELSIVDFNTLYETISELMLQSGSRTRSKPKRNKKIFPNKSCLFCLFFRTSTPEYKSELLHIT